MKLAILTATILLLTAGSALAWNPPPVQVPEPSILALLGVGLLSLGVIVRRR